MYFKVLHGTDTEVKLRELKVRIDKCDDAALALAKELGGDQIGTSNHSDCLAGEIEAIHFKEAPPKELWRKVGESYQMFFMPKVKNKSALGKIAALDKVRDSELNDLVGFPKGLQVVGLSIIRRVGVSFGKTILIESSAGIKMKPPADMVEILESEYEKLKPKE